MRNYENDINDVKLISYYTGSIIIGTGLIMCIPLLVSIYLREYEASMDFLISMNISLIVGFTLNILGKNKYEKTDIQWKHGLIIASLSWILLMILCALPYYLSGHMNSFIDACFDVISGFTTTGVFLLQDLDHISKSLNLWRHILTFIGGQGMVVLALMFLSGTTQGSYKMYVGEGKDISLVPNVKGTARLIWIISLGYMIVGVIALWVNGIAIGLNPMSALFNGFCIFASSWSTGGFGPMSQNMLYYHSFSYEVLTIIIFVLGSLNFGLHYSVIKGNIKELYKNIEVQSFVITVCITTFLAVSFLSKTGVYPDSIALFRKGVYNMLSAHTTTGFMNVYARQFLLDWGDFALIMMIIAMLIGGSACSTAGGFKGLRVGISFKGLIAEVKRFLYSERKIKVFKYHHIKEQVLDNDIVKSSLMIIICYILLFTIGTAIGCFYGYSFIESAFEAASITGNVGMSIGVTAVNMPLGLKIYYILAMYLGRLEFISVFALIGFTIGGIKRVCSK